MEPGPYMQGEPPSCYRKDRLPICSVHSLLDSLSIEDPPSIGPEGSSIFTVRKCVLCHPPSPLLVRELFQCNSPTPYSPTEPCPNSPLDSPSFRPEDSHAESLSQLPHCPPHIPTNLAPSIPEELPDNGAWDLPRESPLGIPVTLASKSLRNSHGISLESPHYRPFTSSNEGYSDSDSAENFSQNSRSTRRDFPPKSSISRKWLFPTTKPRSISQSWKHGLFEPNFLF